MVNEVAFQKRKRRKKVEEGAFNASLDEIKKQPGNFGKLRETAIRSGEEARFFSSWN